MIKNLKTYGSYEDFKKVYKIFKEYPFYEAWTENLFKEEYEYLIQYGEMYGYFIDNQITGLINIIYGAKKDQPVQFSDPSKVIYLADLAVIDAYRGQGIGTKLLLEIIRLYQNNYNEMYLRTNYEGSMSEGIALKCGFEIMKNNEQIITQDCFFERTKEEISAIDKRKFLSRKL